MSARAGSETIGAEGAAANGAVGAAGEARGVPPEVRAGGGEDVDDADDADDAWRYNAAVMLNKLGRYGEALEHVEAFRAGGDEDRSSLALFGELLCKAGRRVDIKSSI